jgi:hypothetical protein
MKAQQSGRTHVIRIRRREIEAPDAGALVETITSPWQICGPHGSLVVDAWHVADDGLGLGLSSIKLIGRSTRSSGGAR